LIFGILISGWGNQKFPNQLEKEGKDRISLNSEELSQNGRRRL
jgi:hypothetical protein